MSSPEGDLPADAGNEAVSNEDKIHFLKALYEGVPGGEPVRPQVEILRKIPAPEPAPPGRDTLESTDALRLAAILEEKLAAGELDALTPQAMQTLLAAMCKLYGASVEAGVKYPVLGDRMAVSGTDAMIMCGALLKAVDLQVFELGMWQSWAGS